MSKTTILSSNFTAGEFSPKLYGRVDIDRYPNAVKLARNGYAFVHGGWRWRMGTRFVAEVKNSDHTARLIPYVLDQNEAYTVEISEGFVSGGPTQSILNPSTARFYTGAGRVEVAATPVEAQLTSAHTPTAKIKYAQDDGLLYLTSQNPFGAESLEIIERITPTSFATAQASVLPRPSAEIQELQQIRLGLTAMSGVLQAIADAACFQPADVGRYLRAGVGYAKITGFNSVTNVTVDTTALGGRPFNFTSYPAGQWLIDSSPQAICTPSATGPIGSSITLTLGIAGWKANAAYTYVGTYVEINGGMCEITAVTSPTVVQAKVWALLTAITPAGPGGWVLRGGISLHGNTHYFNAITFHEQRMVLANSIAAPGPTYGLREWAEAQTLFFSVSGVNEFSIGSADDDALELLAKSETVTPIEHLASFDALVVFTGSTVFKVTGGLEKPITPTNFQIRAQNEDGANFVRPQKIGNEMVYVEASGKRVMALGYKAESDKYMAGDISTLAEHILTIGVVDMAYARRPDPLLFCVLADGQLAICALDREQNVVAWSLCSTDGAFESVATMPYQNNSVVHFVVRRTVNGATRRYVERLEDGRETDCCVLGSSGTAATVWGGFAHLEGKMLDVIADGSFVGQKRVQSAQITLDTPALRIEAGLHYDAQLQLLPVEVRGQVGTNQGDAVSVHEFILRVQNSVGCKVRGRSLVFTRPTNFNVQPPTFSGDWPVGISGWDNDAILIERDKPYAFNLLCAMRKISINQG